MEKNKKKIIRVVELFAGVGGFRLGLEGPNEKWVKRYKVVWSNQWEPATKTQHASDIYIERFGPENHSNEDIAKVQVSSIPDHDLLVGGFPCQDYSVARTLSHAVGIKGEKGVLWWEIHRILKKKGKKGPSFLILENVDRLLKSPADQRGRDFAIMLASLSDLGYSVEWRVINAADYGMPQRRRRVFMLGYKKGSFVDKKLRKETPVNWIMSKGIVSKAFPVLNDRKQNPSLSSFSLKGSLTKLTERFNAEKPTRSPFGNTGMMLDRNVFTKDTKPRYSGSIKNLGDIIQNEKEVAPEFFIVKKDCKDWKYLKGSKKEKRKSKSGFSYFYVEGSVTFPDPLDRPSRTIVTGEGGKSPSRFKHVIRTTAGKLRRLTPVELERLCMFPDNHTEGVSDGRRAFLMGNALVVGVIKKLGDRLIRALS